MNATAKGKVVDKQVTLIQAALENARKAAATPQDLPKPDSSRSNNRMIITNPS